MTVRVQWQQGGEADVVSVKAQHVTLASTISSPPGSRLTGAMPSGTELQVKVQSCKRQAGTDARFAIQGRVLNATKVVLAELAPTP